MGKGEITPQASVLQQRRTIQESAFGNHSVGVIILKFQKLGAKVFRSLSGHQTVLLF